MEWLQADGDLDQIYKWAQLTFLSSIRIFMMLSTIPFFTKNTLVNAVKFYLSLTLAMMLTPFEPNQLLLGELSFVALALKEVFVGFMLGHLIWFPLRALELSGVLIDTQRGATMAEDFNAAFDASSTLISNLFLQCFMAYFFYKKGFLLLLSFYFNSYILWPINHAIPLFDASLTSQYIGCTTDIFKMGVLMAAPIVGALLLVDLIIAVLAKQAQQLQPLMFGMPIKGILSLILLVYYVPILMSEVYGFLEDSFQNLVRIAPNKGDLFVFFG